MRAPAQAAPRRPEPAHVAGDMDPLGDNTVQAVDPGKARTIRIGALVLIGFAVLMAVLFFPDVRRDAALQSTFRPDFNVMVERANCSRYVLVVTHCSVSVSWQDGAGRSMSNSSFLVGLKGMGGLRVIPVRSVADPSVVTSAVAVEHLSNRIWTLVLAPGLCLLLGVLMLLKLRRGGV
jgi:hypothetical protein